MSDGAALEDTRRNGVNLPALTRKAGQAVMHRSRRRPALVGHRSWLIAVPALAAGLAGGTLGGVLHSQTTQVIGGRFVLLDSGGVQRGVVEVSPSGEARIVLTGRNSQSPRAALGVDGEGAAYLQLRDGGGMARAGLEVGADGVTRLSLLNGGAPRVQLREGGDGGAALDLRDAAGRVRASLATAADGTPALTLYDAEGQRTVSIP